MATSHGTKLLVLTAAVTLVVLIGSANCDSSCSDPTNCVACGRECEDMSGAHSKRCSDGTCEYFCNHRYSNCDGDWDNGCEVCIANDVSNCGECGNVCGECDNGEAFCKGGRCRCQRG